MAARALNMVLLIGNLTRDPEMRYTPNGTAVCTFGLATNRAWTTEGGEKKESVQFHRIVAWQKLAEICSKFLSKGRKVFVRGRLQTRNWTGQDGQERQTTEVVIDDMIILDSRRGIEERGRQTSASETAGQPSAAAGAVPVVSAVDDKAAADDAVADKAKKDKDKVADTQTEKKAENKEEAGRNKTSAKKEEKVEPKDIPF